MKSVQIPATDLVRVLNNALQGMISTAKKAYEVNISCLEHAHIKWQAGAMFVTSTDRYIVIWESLPYVDMDESGELLLHFTDIKNIIKTFKDVKSPNLATLSLEDEKLTVSVDGFASLTVVIDQDDFAIHTKTEALMVDWKDESRDFSQFAINPDMLARLVKLQGEGPALPLRFQVGTSANRAIVFRLGETIKGLVMPVRITT